MRGNRKPPEYPPKESGEEEHQQLGCRGFKKDSDSEAEEVETSEVREVRSRCLRKDILHRIRLIHFKL